MSRRLAIAVLAALLAPRPAVAEPVGAAASAAPRAGQVAIASRAVGAVVVDGQLDEAAWAASQPEDGFIQREPIAGAAPSLRTEFRVLYGDHSLYVGVRAYDPEPGAIASVLSRRDADSASDWILLGLDSYRDRRTGFVFGLNPAGVKRDMLIYDDTQVDTSWDAVWEGAARIDAEGWTAEFRIPFGQLRFSAADEQVWGLQIERDTRRLGEAVVWSPWPRGDEQIVSRFGEVRGLIGIAPSRRLELLPYLVAGGSRTHATDGDPFNDGRDPVFGAGLDFRLGLGSSFTLAGTINPDFGQVEADPSQVNLGAGELFFPEKRPFFLEGSDLFRFTAGQGDENVEQLFYSRRIGAPPHGSGADAGDFYAEDDVTTIYGAGKLSGKTAGGWSFGLLEAITGEEEARFALAGGPSQRVAIEPLTSYTVARVRKDLRAGRTSLGGLVTQVARRLDGTGLDWLHDRASAGGLELSHRFAGDAWLVDGKLMGSAVHGSPAALLETQTSSVHYFQRPDADHLDFDPGRTSLTGLAGNASLTRRGDSFRVATGLDTRTPGFEINDLGFQQQSDQVSHWLWLQRRGDRAGATLRDWQVNGNVWHNWNYGGELLGFGGNLNGSLSLLNQWGGNLGAMANHGRRDPGGLRGGPTLRRDTTTRAWWSLWSDPRRTVHGTVGGFAFWAPASDSRGIGIDPAAVWHLAPNAEVALGPSVFVGVDDNQYVDTGLDAMAQPHYLMARLHRVTTGLTVRANYTVSPTLSVELYAQPYLSSGRFDEYKEVVAPQEAAYDHRYRVFADAEVARRGDGSILGLDRDGDGVDDFQVGRPDFDFRELRSNLVVRWEYRPGSTLFAIWSHGRTSEAADGNFRLGDELGGLVAAPGEDLVVAKLSYWFGL